MPTERTIGDALAGAVSRWERELMHEVAMLNLRAEREALAHLVTEGEHRIRNLQRLQREMRPEKPFSIAAE